MPHPATPNHPLTRWAQLTQWQRMAASHTLGQLGADEGVLEDQPPVTDKAHRLHLSRELADQIGLTLAAGEEIAQCRWCLGLTPESAVTEWEDRLWCSTDCLTLAVAEQDALPDRFTHVA